ncbi:hypothetical protein [Bacillus sp. FJAT-26390]|uniref:hypothetical protein n=1 Tax=Bacillus sp. FJAT-26390 TaxID=1743142 RepID=UPI0011479CBD|nr:hypothetical protein [Bacillus sp. FJAT-26390]
MDEIGRILVKLFVALFSLLFVFPAVIFSVLVLGLTDSWKSGTVMLVSSFILFIIVRFNGSNQPSPRRIKKYEASSWEMSPVTLASFRNENPPPLSDIYRDLDLQDGEADVLYKIIVEAKANDDSELYPYYCNKCDQLESQCRCKEKITTPY